MIELILILIILLIILKSLYDRYYPHIDIIKSHNKHTIMLWYNKKVSKNEVIRTYIKFEYET